MKYVDVLEIISQVSPFVGSKDAQGQADQGPQVNCFPGMVALIRQVMDLGVAVVTRRDTITRFSGQDLVSFAFAVSAALFRIAGLEEPTTTATAVVVRAVGVHFDKIFFTHNSFDHITQVFGHRVPKGFPHQLARVLYGKLDLAFAVPFGTDFEFAFADPLGIILNDATDFEFVVDLEFVQSGPDCE